jgi:predicted TIM-barrel fold metal-dependent hydrolase
MKKFTIFISLAFLLASCQKYYKAEDFQSVPKIDSHIHIDASDGAFEDQAAADNFVLITLNVDHSDSAAVRDQFNWAVESTKKHPGKVFYAATFFFDTAGWGTEAWSDKIISQLDKDISAGAIGVKIWKNIGMTVRDRDGKFIMADDPKLEKVINFIKSKNLPIAGHLGEPRNCWLPLDQMTVTSDSSYFARNPQYHMFLHPEYPTYEDQINARDNLLKKNPDLQFIGCHLGSLEWNVDSLASRFDRFPNMVADISARICHLEFQSVKEREKVRNFCIKYQDRLLYGTDVTYHGSKDPESFKKNQHETWLLDWKFLTSDDEMTVRQFRTKFKGLKLPKNVVDKIYYTNAKKWYKLPLI